ncbi:hypothetical protein MRX96_026224 [Rhipicephalus microplus]
MHKFRHYDGIAYVSASLSRELVSIEKTVLMNYGTDRSEVICRTYVRKTLISEKVAYNLEDAKQVLDCAESLHPCRGAGRAKDFTYDVLTKKLEQQISHSDGLVFSVTCKGAVKQQGSSCISCKYVRKVILTRKSYLKRKERRNSVSTKLRVLSQRNKRMATRLLDIAGRLEEMRANNANVADKILEDKISSLPRKQQATQLRQHPVDAYAVGASWRASTAISRSLSSGCEVTTAAAGLASTIAAKRSARN